MDGRDGGPPGGNGALRRGPRAMGDRDDHGHPVHPGAIPADVVERIVRRRGRAHVFEAFDPVRTALVVIDMQNAFVRAGMGHAHCPAAAGIVPVLNRLAAGLRSAGGRVAWIRTAHASGSPQDWSVLYDHLIPLTAGAREEALTPGSPGHALVDELDVDPADAIVEKYRYSAFLPGASTLPALLRAEGRDTVMICGTVTNVCCESSARDAMMLNFKTVMVSDGNAAGDDATHWASLTTFYSTFGDVLSSRQILGRLASATAA